MVWSALSWLYHRRRNPQWPLDGNLPGRGDRITSLTHAGLEIRSSCPYVISMPTPHVDTSSINERAIHGTVLFRPELCCWLPPSFLTERTQVWPRGAPGYNLRGKNNDGKMQFSVMYIILKGITWTKVINLQAFSRTVLKTSIRGNFTRPKPSICNHHTQWERALRRPHFGMKWIQITTIITVC